MQIKSTTFSIFPLTLATHPPLPPVAGTTTAQVRVRHSTVPSARIEWLHSFLLH